MFFWFTLSLIFFTSTALAAARALPPAAPFVSTAEVAQLLATSTDTFLPQTSSVPASPTTSDTQPEPTQAASHAARAVTPAVVASILGVALLAVVFIGYRRYRQKKQPQAKRLADEKGEHPQFSENRPYIPSLP